MSYMRDVDGVRLDTISVATDGDVTGEAAARVAGDAANAAAIAAQAAAFAVKVYEMSGVELAHAENATGVNTTVPIYSTAALAVPGCLINVPANADPVWLEWGGTFAVTIAGSGLLQLSVWDVTAGGVGTEVYSGYRGVTSAQPLYSGYGNNFLGRRRLEVSTSDRLFQLKTQLIRDGASSLSAVLWNTTALPSFISAVQR